MELTPLRPVRESLSDGVIEIRRYRASFAPDLYAAVDETRPDLEAWMFWAKPGFSPADAADSASRYELAWPVLALLPYAIFDPADGRFLGGVGCSSLNPIHRFANLGYWVRASASGRGVAARATRLLTRIAFEDVGLHRLELVIAVGNDRSKRVAEKVGAHFEGVLRRRLVTRDGVRDAYSYSLIDL